MSETESLLEFPCQFGIKVMGKNQDDFDALVAQIVRQHVNDLHEGAVSSRPSKAGNYTAVTITIEAQSKDQLDAIYRALTARPEVLMAL